MPGAAGQARRAILVGWHPPTPTSGARRRPAAGPPVPERRPVRARGPRRRPDRRLVLAAGQGRPGGHRPPRGRERLHRGGHGRHRPRSRTTCSRDGGPDRGDRPVGPGPQGPLARTTAAPWRAAATASTAGGRRRPAGTGRRRPGEAGRATARRARSCWTRTCWPRGTSTSRSATWRSAPTTAGWPTPPTPPAASATPCASATSAPAAESPEALEDTSYGVAWANDNATVFYVRVDEAMRPYQLWRHRVGTDPAARRPGLRGARRALLPRGGPDQGRPVHPHAASTPR